MSFGIGEVCLLQHLLLGPLADDATDDAVMQHIIKNLTKLTMFIDLSKSCHEFTHRFFLASGVKFKPSDSR